MVSTSMVMRSHESKRNAAIAAIAVSMARMDNNQLYFKMKRYRTLWKDTKDQILQRYGSQASVKWAQNQAKPKKF